MRNSSRNKWQVPFPSFTLQHKYIATCRTLCLTWTALPPSLSALCFCHSAPPSNPFLGDAGPLLEKNDDANLASTTAITGHQPPELYFSESAFSNTLLVSTHTWKCFRHGSVQAAPTVVSMTPQWLLHQREEKIDTDTPVRGPSRLEANKWSDYRPWPWTKVSQGITQENTWQLDATASLANTLNGSPQAQDIPVLAH